MDNYKYSTMNFSRPSVNIYGHVKYIRPRHGKLLSLLFPLALYLVKRCLQGRPEDGNSLTPAYFLDKGWKVDGTTFTEPDVPMKLCSHMSPRLSAPDRARTSVSFHPEYYIIRHGREITYVGNGRSVAWFEMYHFLVRCE